jgi:hypothetical protein
VPSPHRVGGVTAAQVPPEAAKKHVGAPLSPENVTIVKFRQNFRPRGKRMTGRAEHSAAQAQGHLRYFIDFFLEK